MSNTVLLKDIADIITGPFGSQLHESDYVPEGIPSIMPQNIGNRILNYDGIARITEKDAKRLSRYLVKENDIVYARRGDVEKHAFISAQDEGALCGTGCLRVRIISDAVYPTYLSHFLNRPETRRWITLHAVGSNMPNINTDILGAVPIELPAYETQKAIADMLSDIDKQINLNTRLYSELEAMAKTLYDYWFVQFDFPDGNGKPYRTSGGAMEWCQELGREVPKGWKAGTLSDFVSIQKEGFDPSGYGDVTVEHYSIPAYDDEHYPSFDPANTILSGKYAVPLGSILFSKLNPQFKRIWNPPCLSDVRACSTEFMVYLPVNEALRPFIYATLNSDAFYRFTVQIASSSTGSRKRLDPDATLKYAILKPDSGITQQFCDQVKPIMEQVKKLQIENHELTKLRDWLLPMLMNGQATIVS